MYVVSSNIERSLLLELRIVKKKIHQCCCLVDKSILYIPKVKVNFSEDTYAS